MECYHYFPRELVLISPSVCPKLKKVLVFVCKRGSISMVLPPSLPCGFQFVLAVSPAASRDLLCTSAHYYSVFVFTHFFIFICHLSATVCKYKYMIYPVCSGGVGAYIAAYMRRKYLGDERNDRMRRDTSEIPCSLACTSIIISSKQIRDSWCKAPKDGHCFLVLDADSSVS